MTATTPLLSAGFNTGGEASYGELVGAAGVHFITADGRRLIDGSNTSCPLGHAHPEIVAAVRDVADAPTIIDGWHWPDREHAARELIEIAFADSGDWAGAVRFFLSASEANDAALSLAQALTGRGAVATRERAYHGFAGLSRDVTVQPHWHGGLSRGGGVLPAPRMAEVVELPAPVGARYRNPDAPEVDSAALLADAERRLAEVAGVVIDYSQGGVYHDPPYQDRLAEAARAAGALWIADETVTGFGRVGGWFGFERAESCPDMVVLGKSMAGGGAPGGAVVLSAELAERLAGTSWRTYSTFRGHPAAVSAVRAHLRVSSQTGLVERARELESVLADRLLEIAGRHPAVARVDGRGMHWTIELQGPSWRDWRADSTEAPIASLVAARAVEAGALIGTSGEQTSLFIAPPLVIKREELEALLDALDHGLEVADNRS